MKTCPNCTSEIEDNFDLCWNCQYSFADDKVLDNSDFISICPKCNKEVKSYLNSCPYCHCDLNEHHRESETNPADNKHVDCLRCKVPLDFLGNFKFNEAAGAGSAGNLLEVFINRESFDIYSCPECGKIEFFLPGFD
jgi:hypothetical protein